MDLNVIAILLIYILLIVIFEACAQNSFKMYYTDGNTTNYYLGILFYAIVGFFLIKSYDYQQMGIVNVIWSALSIISILLIGHIYWKEQITNSDIIGSIFIFIGLVLVLYNDKNYSDKE